MTDDPPTARGLFTGVANIVRFNPRFYVMAAAVFAVAAAAILLAGPRLPSALVHAGWFGIGLAAWWVVGSLLASWWIYDLSELYRWDWLERCLGPRSDVWAVAHAGFDEVTVLLQERFPDVGRKTFDFHDPERMTEPSIRRARRICPPLPGTIPVGLGPWPGEDRFDLVLFPLSAHEWRRPAERSALLRHAADTLAEGGRIVLLEHLRDLRNFLAFGPGFLHFHSEEAWRRDWEAAGLECVGRFRVAGFLGAFVLVPKTHPLPPDD